jgi:uncharacterized protein
VDASGKGTFDRIVGSLKVFAVEIPDRFSATAVLSPGNNPADVFEGIAALGVRRIELVPSVSHDSSLTPKQSDIDCYVTFIDKYVESLLTAADDQPVLVRFENCMRRIMGYRNSRVPCGAGRSFFGIGPEGDLFPCFRFIGVDAYQCGSLENGLDNKRVETFQTNGGCSYERRSRCIECWAAPLCGGPCFSCAELFGTGDGNQPDYLCAYTLADATAAIKLVQQLRESNPERLLRFLPQNIAIDSIVL